MRPFLRFLSFTTLLFGLSSQAYGFSFAGKATDDSVCDLSPLTSYRLGTRTFVEAGTLNSDQIYARLALRIVTQNCKNGQTLILDSEDGDAFDAKYFRDVANRLCAIAEISRVAAGTTQYPEAFQIKCRILKVQEASDWLLAAEKDKSTEAMISEGAPRHKQTSSSAPSASSPDSKDCDKMNLSSIMFGRGDCK